MSNEALHEHLRCEECYQPLFFLSDEEDWLNAFCRNPKCKKFDCSVSDEVFCSWDS